MKSASRISNFLNVFDNLNPGKLKATKKLHTLPKTRNTKTIINNKMSSKEATPASLGTNQPESINDLDGFSREESQLSQLSSDQDDDPSISIDNSIAKFEPINEFQKSIFDKSKIFLSKQTQPIIIPSFSAWFSFDLINEIERENLPEFFTNKNIYKTEKIYKKCRDFMINCYRLQPSEYLTVTAVRKNLSIDVASIIRIHAFLEQWGLINYQIDPKAKPMIGGKTKPKYKVIFDEPIGFKDRLDDSVIENGNNDDENGTVEQQNTVIDTTVRRKPYDNILDAASLQHTNHDRITQLSGQAISCHATGNDISQVRFHNLRSKVSIGPKPFKQGLFPANFHSSDFIRLINEEDGSKNGSSWSDQELFLLMEGIEMFDDDWDSVSRHVRTKTKEQCIIKFVQLPIEDQYLIKKEEKELKGEELSMNEVLEYLVEEVDPDLAKQVKESLKSSSTAQNQVDTGIEKEIAETAMATIISNSIIEQDKQVDEMKSLTYQQTELLLSKFITKLNRLESIETHLQQVASQVENDKLQVYLDRVSLGKHSAVVLNLLKESIQIPVDEGIAQAARAVAMSNKVPPLTWTTVKKDEVKPISLDNPELYNYWSG